MNATILPFPLPAPRHNVDDELAKLDAVLHGTDAGYQAAQLHAAIDRWTRTRERLELWQLNPITKAGNPAGLDWTLRDVDALLRGLHDRLRLAECFIRDQLRIRGMMAAKDISVTAAAILAGCTNAMAAGGELVATSEGVAAVFFGGAALGVLIGGFAAIGMMRSAARKTGLGDADDGVHGM